MKVDIIPIGNSRGVRIPKALLAQCRLGKTAEMHVEGERLVIEKPRRKPREGWEEAFAKMAERGDDMTEELAEWRDFPNDFDKNDWVW